MIKTKQFLKKIIYILIIIQICHKKIAPNSSPIQHSERISYTALYTSYRAAIRFGSLFTSPGAHRA